MSFNAKQRSITKVLVATALLLSCAQILPSQEQDEYRQRRQAAMKKMEPDSVLILRSDPVGRGSSPFRPDNNFYYLTGISRAGTSLVLSTKESSAPGRTGRRAGTSREILFIPSSRRGTDGEESRPEGFSSIRVAAEFENYLERTLLGDTSLIYFDYQHSRSLSVPLTADEILLKAARDRGASFTVKPASAILSPLRRVKSESEIELLKQAIDITAAAQREVMRAARPGMWEYQLQSVIEHVFSMNGARRPGFSTIVGSGSNSCILHWSENTRQAESGDLVVLDIGAEFEMYTADITRTIPINGKFTRRQREIYEIVLKANQEAIGMIAPGVEMRDVSDKVREILAEGLVGLDLIKDIGELRRYYYHGLSHPIGLQVHDVGGLGVLEPGMVITIEPGIYIREEGMGVRIEDDVLVTENGRVVLTDGAPRTVVEVEGMMQEEGIDFTRYLISRR